VTEMPAARGWPFAGLAALLIILVSDPFANDNSGNWGAIAEQGRSLGLIERGVVADRLELYRLATRPTEALSLYVMGTSRAQQAIRTADDLGVPVDYAMLTHPGLQPFEMLSLAHEVVSSHGDMVVIVASAFDTHRPLSLGPQTAPGSTSAWLDLTKAMGLPFAFAQRDVVLQLLLSSLLETYRFRAIYSGLGPAAWRHFGEPPEGEGITRGLTPLVSHVLVDMDRALLHTRELFPFLPDNTLLQEIRLVQGVTVGPHVPIQRALLRRTCEVLVEGGCEVVLLEGPLHPLADRYHDASVRRHFLLFADELEHELGVQVLTLEDTGPYLSDDFADLTHLSVVGSAKLVAVLHETLAPLAAERWAKRAPRAPAR
jgi:hypothetical protein